MLVLESTTLRWGGMRADSTRERRSNKHSDSYPGSWNSSFMKTVGRRMPASHCCTAVRRKRIAQRTWTGTLLPLLLLLSVLSDATASDLRIQVPHTASAVMVDGVLSKDEWQNAKRIDVPGVATLYFQESPECVYIAVEYTNSPSGIVDLYLSP